MKLPIFEKAAFSLFIATLLILAVYNLSQEKDTDDFLTKQVGEEMEDAKDSRPVIDELKDRMLNEDVKVDTAAVPIAVSFEDIIKMNLYKSVVLEDVTKGDTVKGITTEGLATGTARAGMVDGNYYLNTVINGLPELSENNYYEVWATRRIPFTYVSLGQLELNDNMQYQMSYGSNRDFIYDFLYISLEGEDGNPRPSDFILQGEFN